MFGCQKCAVLEDALKYEREQNKALLERLLGASPSSVAQSFNPKDYYGGGEDEVIEYDQYGQKIIRTEKQ